MISITLPAWSWGVGVGEISVWGASSPSPMCEPLCDHSCVFAILLLVREKVKNMVVLLKDEVKLKEERRRAMQAKERQEGIGSEGSSIGAKSTKK